MEFLLFGLLLLLFIFLFELLSLSSLSPFTRCVLLVELFGSFLSKGGFLFFSRVTVESNFVFYQLDSWINFCSIVWRQKFNRLELIYDFNSVRVIFFLCSLLFLFLLDLLFRGLFVRLTLFRLDDLGSTFDFFLPFFSETKLSRLFVSWVLVFLELIRSKTLAIVNQTLT